LGTVEQLSLFSLLSFRLHALTPPFFRGYLHKVFFLIPDVYIGLAMYDLREKLDGEEEAEMGCVGGLKPGVW